MASSGGNTDLVNCHRNSPDRDPVAVKWSETTGRPMHAMSVETDRFKIVVVFHDCRSQKLSDEAQTLAKALIPIK